MDTSWMKPAAWGAVAGAIGISIAGFAFLGWHAQSTVQDLLEEEHRAGMIEALVPFCVAKGLTEPEKVALIKEESSSYRQRGIVEDAGWPSYPEGASSSLKRALNDACAEQLAQADVSQG